MILVIAEHDNSQLKPATLTTISAARQLNAAITLLVAGLNCAAVVAASVQIEGVTTVIHADAQAYAQQLPENMASLIGQLAAGYEYILAPATTFGKNCLPRAAALMDSTQISDVVAIIAKDTFVRPIYAGNAFATVQVQKHINFSPFELRLFLQQHYLRSITPKLN